MLQNRRILRLVAFAVTATCLSCQGPKAPSKANFKRAIQASLDKQPTCLSVALPIEPRNMFTQQPTTDPFLEALTRAGLVDKKRVMVKNVGMASWGGPQAYLGTRYDITAEGRKYAVARREPLGLIVGGQTLCYGVPHVVDIVRYSEPGNMMGQTMTEVTYTYDLKSVAPWINNPALLKQFSELAHVPTPDHPQERQVGLVLMNDGWRVAGLGL